MAKGPIVMSREGEDLESIENGSDSRATDSQQEVIEILTDGEDDLSPSSNGNNDATTNNNEPYIIEDLNDDDEIQITGTNNMESDSIRTRRIRRRGNEQPEEPERNVRRRTQNDEDDIQIIDERPAERRLSPQEGVASNPLLQRMQRVQLETPIGIFQSYENSSGSVSGSDGERNRYTEPPHRITTRSRRARRLRTPRSGNFVALDHFVLSQQLYHNMYGDWDVPESIPNSDTIEGSVMARIERDNENLVDQRLQNENIYNRVALNNKKGISESELPGYSNDIKPDLNLCCELCGVTLGEGIPDDFKPNLYYNEGDNFSKFCQQYEVQAPWFCIKQCMPVDIDLSKRVFAAKCGHVYCGRCVKNIGNRPSGRRKQNQKLSIDNPLISCPRKCASSECNLNFTGKKSFTELYF